MPGGLRRDRPVDKVRQTFYPTDGEPHVFPALPLSRFRLPALTLIISALTLTACNAPPSSTLPLAPEAASGYRTDLQTRHASQHMAAAANPLAAEAGREMLRKGGSAIDAAIAMQAVLTLVEPQSSGIGGGAMIVLWDGKQVRTYDGRETARRVPQRSCSCRPTANRCRSRRRRLAGARWARRRVACTGNGAQATRPAAVGHAVRTGDQTRRARLRDFAAPAFALGVRPGDR